jgi:hypothetical protein
MVTGRGEAQAMPAGNEQMGLTPSEFVRQMASLNDEQRLHFYEVLAHNLTVAIRSIWSDKSITADEKVERIKWVNEILHSTTAKVWVLRLKTHEWTEEDFGSDIGHYIALNPSIATEVSSAVSRSYRAAAPNSP